MYVDFVNKRFPEKYFIVDKNEPVSVTTKEHVVKIITGKRCSPHIAGIVIDDNKKKFLEYENVEEIKKIITLSEITDRKVCMYYIKVGN
jgi:hypothetical protein